MIFLRAVISLATDMTTRLLGVQYKLHLTIEVIVEVRASESDTARPWMWARRSLRMAHAILNP